MSDYNEINDHTTEFASHRNNIGVDEVYDELDKLINSVDAEEREIKVSTWYISF